MLTNMLLPIELLVPGFFFLSEVSILLIEAKFVLFPPLDEWCVNVNPCSTWDRDIIPPKADGPCMKEWRQNNEL